MSSTNPVGWRVYKQAWPASSDRFAEQWFFAPIGDEDLDYSPGYSTEAEALAQLDKWIASEAGHE